MKFITLRKQSRKGSDIFSCITKTLVFSGVLQHCKTGVPGFTVSRETQDGATAKSRSAALFLRPSCVLLPAPLCRSSRQSHCHIIACADTTGQHSLGQLKQIAKLHLKKCQLHTGVILCPFMTISDTAYETNGTICTLVVFLSKNLQWKWFKKVRDDIVYSSGTSGRFSAVGWNGAAPNSQEIEFTGITSVRIYSGEHFSPWKLITNWRKQINATNVVFMEAFKYARLADCILAIVQPVPKCCRIKYNLLAN